MGLFNDFTSFVGDNAGNLLDAGLSYFGGQENQNSAQDALAAYKIAQAGNSADALKNAQPWSGANAGGTASFDPESQTALMGLSPELQAIYDGALGRSGMWGGMATTLGLDPFKAADNFYNENQKYWDPKEAQMRTDLESRLMAQGRLGSTGGNRAVSSVNEGIAQSQQGRRTDAMGQAQNMITQLLGREKGDLGIATGLLGVPMDLAELGMGIGGTQSSLSSNLLKSANDADFSSAKVNAVSNKGDIMNDLAAALGGR